MLVGDVRFVLDTLLTMREHDPFWTGHLDLSRVGIVGHSMGGTTAALAAKNDGRIKAVVNLDGSTYPGLNADVRPIPVLKPLLFVATEEHASDAGTRGHEYVGSQGNTYYAVIAGADHMSFTDARLLAARFSRAGESHTDSSDLALRVIELTRAMVVEFCGKYLRGERALLLDAVAHIERD